MDAEQVLALGLGVTPPWRLAGQHLETGKHPHELHLRLEADRGFSVCLPGMRSGLQGTWTLPSSAGGI
ncbi:hypothetical protein ACIDI_48c00020 [Acidiphilium sp. JA12-A1]|nr:hypothetical protein ACIDI_48c00020 [Acidiphilium sp. JA12-A1]